MKHTLEFTLLHICITLLLFTQCHSPEISETKKEKSTLLPYECVSIDELKKMTESGNIIKPQINIRGKVIKKFICPPCPEGYDCEKCPDDYIIVSDGKNDIRIAYHPEFFELDQEYCFSLKKKQYNEEFPFNIMGWEKNPGKSCCTGK